MSSSREGSTQQSVAQSLREATQLLLLAAERLDPSGSRPHDSTRGDSVAGPSRSVRECLRSDSIRDNSNSRFSRSTPTTDSTTSATGDTPPATISASPTPLPAPTYDSKEVPTIFREEVAACVCVLIPSWSVYSSGYGRSCPSCASWSRRKTSQLQLGKQRGGTPSGALVGISSLT